MKKLLLFGAIALSTATLAQVPNYVPTNGLVGWWGFNGNANDESGNGNNGTVNGATLTADRFGNTNGAYSFNGSNYISINSNPSFNVNDLTFSCWFLRNNSQDNDALFGIRASDTDTRISFHVENGNTGIGIYNGTNWIPLAVNTDNDIWYQAIFTISNGICEIFLNGNSVGTFNSNVGSGIDNPVWIGQPDNTLPYNIERWNGNLDDIGIWNRALTLCEIADLYNSQLGFLNTTSTQTETALDSYTWPVNNQTYNQSGTYTAIIPNEAGCDSTITLDLTMQFTGIEELIQSEKKLVKIVDFMGRETEYKPNIPLIFIYSDGTRERVMKLEE